jgi:predicted transcriptional regulator
MVTCPHCGATFSTRNPMGAGTRSATEKALSATEEQVLDALQELGSASVREVERYFFQNKTRREGRKDWNYHLIQADLSRLVGRGLVAMEPLQRSWLYHIAQDVGKPKVEQVLVET